MNQTKFIAELSKFVDFAADKCSREIGEELKQSYTKSLTSVIIDIID